MFEFFLLNKANFSFDFSNAIPVLSYCVLLIFSNETNATESIVKLKTKASELPTVVINSKVLKDLVDIIICKDFRSLKKIGFKKRL